MRLETLEAVRRLPRGTPFPARAGNAENHSASHPPHGVGLEPGPEMDRFERKMERVLANGRQRYALVLMTIVPIERLSGSRWVPMFRQLTELDDDLIALIAARRRAAQRPGGENVLDDLLAATHEDGSMIDDREASQCADHGPHRRPR